MGKSFFIIYGFFQAYLVLRSIIVTFFLSFPFFEINALLIVSKSCLLWHVVSNYSIAGIAVLPADIFAVDC